ncbi:Scr1 family TA system antitoxin-like transcriptional regulator [Streptomyces tendae]|uniref:Scr1 family TA system antitoxin-like transcriptional regulator n=1 Tax=Streptomyces tendae TaxID=1932 RepID=UPI00340E7D5F
METPFGERGRQVASPRPSWSGRRGALPAHQQHSVCVTSPTANETVVHEAALRIRLGDRAVSRAQLHRLLDESEREHITVRVIPFDTDHFAGASAAMMHVGGPLPQLDTVLRDSPNGTAFLDAQSQLERFRTLFRKVEQASLDPNRTRDFIHHLAKEL